MVGLNAIPEPLWWLLGAIVAFYFGARETHYFRNRPVAVATAAAKPVPPSSTAYRSSTPAVPTATAPSPAGPKPAVARSVTATTSLKTGLSSTPLVSSSAR